MRRRLAPYVVYGFASTHRALDAEAVLTEAAIDVVAIPTPKAMGALCGVALRVPPMQSAQAEERLAQAGIEPSAKAEMEDL